MEDEGEDVGADEDDGVGPRFEAREGFAVDDYDAGKAEVDTGGEEGGSDGEADEIPAKIMRGLGIVYRTWLALHQEWIRLEHIIVHLHPCHVANHFQRLAEDPGDQEGPCAVIHPKQDLCGKAGGEEGEEEGIAAKRGDVVDVSPAHGTCLHCTKVRIIV